MVRWIWSGIASHRLAFCQTEGGTSWLLLVLGVLITTTPSLKVMPLEGHRGGNERNRTLVSAVMEGPQASGLTCSHNALTFQININRSD
jgi:hypothetical protein